LAARLSVAKIGHFGRPTVGRIHYGHFAGTVEKCNKVLGE
jgi:hypothetical protein